MKPNFFIIGAPKCGTTSMANWLRSNPQVFMPVEKEPSFFNEDALRAHYTTLEKYESLFLPVTKQHRAVGEATSTYLESSVAVQRILDYQPDARFIVMLRTPLEMVVSLHAEELSILNEEIDTFEEAWAAQQDRARGKRIPTFCRAPSLLAYGPRCRLGGQLRQLGKWVASDRVHVAFLEDFQSDPESAYRDVTDFLGVDAEALPDFAPANPRHKHRFRQLVRFMRAYEAATLRIDFHHQTGIMARIRGWNRAPAQRTELSDAMRIRLIDYYRDDVRLLEELTGRDLGHWLS